MKKSAWKNNIKKACVSAGTYQPFFDSVIDTLAGILQQRDAAEEIYKYNGEKPVVQHTIRNGAVNVVKNPELVLILELNAQALSYWKELGLTPNGLKKINQKALAKSKKSLLSEVLKDFD